MATNLIPADTLARDAQAHRLFMSRIPAMKAKGLRAPERRRRIDAAIAKYQRHLDRWLRRHSDDGCRPRERLSVADMADLAMLANWDTRARLVLGMALRQ
jgi:hypothetical protein